MLSIQVNDRHLELLSDWLSRRHLEDSAVQIEICKLIRDGDLDLQMYFIRAIQMNDVQFLGNLFEKTNEFFEILYVFDNDFQGESPLHWASKFGFTEGVRFLLDKAKVNINQLSEMKMRAIDVAAASGKLDIVDLFVQNYNIDPFISEQKRNCLDWAISEKQNEVVEYLKDLEVKRNLNLKRNLELEEETKESESEILPAFKKIKD